MEPRVSGCGVPDPGQAGRRPLRTCCRWVKQRAQKSGAGQWMKRQKNYVEKKGHAIKLAIWHKPVAAVTLKEQTLMQGRGRPGCAPRRAPLNRSIDDTTDHK
jgi:hypothetical protein